MDTLTPEERSANMGRIRSSGTKPEKAVRRLVYAMGYRYRLHLAKLPGKPDLVFPGRKKVIFVHGCFWHQHENCIDGRIPKSHVEYWQPKLMKNVQRDREHHNRLSAMGWKFLVVWECEASRPQELEKRIKDFLDGAMT